jgi:predicted transcriptional regulator/KaiC/GvpD/RAD55 family RecA-like ATPase
MYRHQKRTRYDIYADIIGVVKRSNPCSLTRICYGANVSPRRAKKDLDFLAAHGFIRQTGEKGSRKYEVTSWGVKYYEAYKCMYRFLAALEEPKQMEIPEITLPGRVPTGYKELDNLLYGGIPENCAVVLSSMSCDERNLLVKRFLVAGAEKKQATLYATVRSVNMQALFGELELQPYLIVCNPQADTFAESSPRVLKLKGAENLNEIQFAFDAILREMDIESSKPRRACIEIVSDILLQHGAVATRRWLSGLIPELKAKGFTTLAVMDPQMHHSEETHAILGLFEGEISIYEKETESGIERFLKIKKMCNERYIENELLLKKETLFADGRSNTLANNARGD